MNGSGNLLLESEIKKGKERHLSGYNFCGPGTKLRSRFAGKYEELMDKYKKTKVGRAPYDKPVNNLDAACKRHDIAFSKKGLSAAKVRQADSDLIRAAKSIQNNTRVDKQQRKDARKVRYGIRGKVLAEDVGILRKGSFSSGGEKESKLKQKVKSVVKEKAKEAIKKKAKDLLKKGIKQMIQGKIRK